MRLPLSISTPCSRLESWWRRALSSRRAPRSARARPSAPCLGRVIVQDDVEIGANAAVERGALADTVIGEGSTIGALTLVASQTCVERFALVVGSGIFSSADLV
jgi:UDP-3-O-[3-hydroxymyristoyl] glucosamine N-acyltransferase